MRTVACTCLLLSLLSFKTSAQDNYFDKGIQQLSQEFSSQTVGNQNLTVAVVAFSVPRNMTRCLGEFVADQMVNHLNQTSARLTNKFKLVERSALNEIIKQQKLTFSGPFDRKAASELGKLLSAEAIITGSIIS